LESEGSVFGPVLKMIGALDASVQKISADRDRNAGSVRAVELNLLFREDTMSGLDIFAWIVLIILIASIVAVFCIAGWLPGHIAKTRGHPQAQVAHSWHLIIASHAH
jgi:hypothetical protein